MAHPDADLQARLPQAFGDLIAMQIHRTTRGRQRPRRTAAARLLQVGAQIPEPLVGRLLNAQILRVEAREQHDLTPRPRDRHIEPPLPTGMTERSETQRDIAALIGGERQREQNRIPLLALRILQAPHEQAISRLQRLIDPLRTELLAQQLLDRGALVGAEGDDPQRWHALRVRLEAPDHLLDDLTRLHRVGAGPDSRASDLSPLPVVGAALHAPQADAVAIGAVVGPVGQGQRAGEGQQAAVVVVPVGESDERLHPTAVVPRQPTTRHTTGQAAVQNRAALAAVRTLQVLTGLGAPGTGAGGICLGSPTTTTDRPRPMAPTAPATVI